MALVAAVALLMSPRGASADTAPPDPSIPPTVSADALPTVQVDGVVWSQVVVGNTVYAGGRFTTARPAGSAPGVNTTPRGNMLAYDIRTGALNTSFAPNFNAQVLAVTASPDGARVYAVGEFTSVNGVNRYRIAAFSTATGQLITTFAPVVDARARAIAVTNSTVYVGGSFGTANGNSRLRLAAFQASNGALLSWAPAANAGVWSMVITPDQSKVIAGGQFTTLSGVDAYGMGAIGSTSGAILPWAANQVVRDAQVQGAITSLSTDGTKIYGTGYSFDLSMANMEGNFAANPDTGAIIWIADCHGDHYSNYVTGGVLYTVGHAHYCGNMGGFPQTNPWTFHHSLAMTSVATHTLQNDPLGYPSFGGQPSPTLLNWFPDYVTGTFTGQGQAGWSITGNTDYVVVGGEFPQVNASAQQGLVRFAVRSIAPNQQGPRVTGSNFVPSVASLAAGTVRAAWQANWDRDNELLTYKLVRDGNLAAPVYQTTMRSTFWTRPSMGFRDTGLTPGQTYRYRLYVNDPLGNTVAGDNVTVTVAASGSVSQYAQDVLDDSAKTYWRLNEASGTTAFDWAGFNDGLVSGGVTRGAGGAIIGDSNTASTFDGTDNGLVATRTETPGPDTFTLESWVKTTSTTGGKIIGFGNVPSGGSGLYDRHVYMTDAGRLVFGVYLNGTHTITTSATYNDGQWHHIVAEMGPDGMTFYVDAKRIGRDAATTAGHPYSGYWRVGGDSIGGWPDQPGSNDFNGAIDEVAVYDKTLTATQVSKHYTDSGRTIAGPVRPSDTYGQAIWDSDPDFFWRLGESSGAVANDTSPNEQNGQYTGGVTLGAQGGVTGTTNTAITLDGSDGLVSSVASMPAPSVYSEELWFKTTTTSGGKLIGFGSSPTGGSAAYDRHVYMFDDGRLRFGAWQDGPHVVDSTNSYNDGQWHHVVATQGGDGMKLYVDAQLVGTDPQTTAVAYDGYWRVGGDNTWGGSSSNYFAGTVDEVAVYSSVLNAADVTNHYGKGGGNLPNQDPTAAFTPHIDGLSVSFDTIGSSDPDGNVASYAWDFGDNQSGTGGSPTHDYANPGTYTVTLTVTDNDGATDSVTHDVTVTTPPPNVNPTAAFTPTPTGLAVSFDGSGSSDPDGNIVSYAWNFGDGWTGSGVFTSHTYAAAGTYTVTLTVTDNDGGTNPVSHDVTLTVPAFATDAFARTVSGGWGSADTGGPWTLTGGASNFSVGGGVGQLKMATAGAQPTASLNGVSSTSTETRVTVALDKAQTGGGTYVSVVGRMVGTTGDYRVKLKYLVGGSVSASLTRTVSGTETTLASATVPALTYNPGDVLAIKLQVYGTAPTTVSAKVWRRGQTEPAGWLLTTTDATAALQAAGGVGVIGYLSGSATNAPMTASFDDFWAGPRP
jgi:PKD repeat protein